MFWEIMKTLVRVVMLFFFLMLAFSLAFHALMLNQVGWEWDGGCFIKLLSGSCILDFTLQCKLQLTGSVLTLRESLKTCRSQ